MLSTSPRLPASTGLRLKPCVVIGPDIPGTRKNYTWSRTRDASNRRRADRPGITSTRWIISRTRSRRCPKSASVQNARGSGCSTMHCLVPASTNPCRRSISRSSLTLIDRAPMACAQGLPQRPEQCSAWDKRGEHHSRLLGRHPDRNAHPHLHARRPGVACPSRRSGRLSPSAPKPNGCGP